MATEVCEQVKSSMAPKMSSMMPARDELSNLDTLRALAVAAVLADHLILTLNGLHFHNPLAEQFAMRLGTMGVVAFFVHTCLVLMLSLERLHAESSRPERAFYLRRAFRIYPLAICTVLLASALRIPELPLSVRCESCYAAPNIVLNLLLAQNVAGTSLIAPLWSLPFEVQMYLALPLIYRLAACAGAVRKIAGLTGCFVLLAIVFPETAGIWRFLDFIPCFLSGVLAYVLRRHVRARFGGVWWLALVLAALISGSVAAVLWWEQRRSISWMVSLTLGGTLCLFHDSNYRAWNVVTKTVAKYSYGIYLLHVPSLWLVFRVLGITAPVAGAVLSLAVTAVTAVAAFHAVERPLVTVGKNWARGFRLAEGKAVAGRGWGVTIEALRLSQGGSSRR